VDRDDARFVADALDSRISGDREALDQLAASSFVRLGASAARLSGLAADWPPALLAVSELKTIAMYGAKAADGPAPPDLQIFVDKLRELAAEPPQQPRNRHQRRRDSKIHLPRRARVAGRLPAARLH
jgi:hypothetical protein